MNRKSDSGAIILLNGASSSGKSTLAKALQARLSEPFWHYSIDHLRESKVIPMDRILSGEFDWAPLRPAFFDGFHRSLSVFAAAGNNLIVEHIVETEAWMRLLVELLAPFDVFFIGVHCPLDELERREVERGNRRMGEARADFGVVHAHAEYDLELSSMRPLEDNVNEAVSAWENRLRPSAFERMAQD